MCNGRDALLRVRWPHAVFGRAGAHDGEAHPSCDRLRGSLRSGDMSPREGRAPARPLPPCRFRSSGSSTLPRRPAVAENCGPPATRGDGALAIVSANRLPEISPFPRNARRRGRRRHGKSANARMARRNRKPKIMNRKFTLPAANCQLATGNCKKRKGTPRGHPLLTRAALQIPTRWWR